LEPEWRRSSVVGVATMLRAGWFGVRIPVRISDFFVRRKVQTGSGTHPHSIQWVPGSLVGGTAAGGGEDNHSPPPSAEVKSEWSYISTPSIYIHGVDRESVAFFASRSWFECKMTVVSSCKVVSCLHTW